MRQQRVRSVVVAGVALLASCLGVVACTAPSGPGAAGERAALSAPTSAPTSDPVATTGSVVPGGSTRPAAGAATPPSLPQAFTALQAVDLASGRTVSLASLMAPDRPTLFWAWAPY